MTDLSYAESFVPQIVAAPDLTALENLRVAAVGKQGEITALLKTLGKMSPDERQARGPAIQALREAVTGAIAQRRETLERAALDAKLVAETLDMTLPVDAAPAGSVHPVSQVMDELAEIFADLGFSVATGPEIETEANNFDKLNIPASHPARAMHDTFYFPSGDGARMLLRTHTSPVQVRTMQAVADRTGGRGEPIRIIAPGRTYRSDSDATHTPMFHQVEGLVIDRGITMGHLKWTLETFLRAYFERDDIVLRLRPSYFPFTEPSAEVDVGYTLTKGKRIIGGSDGWMEVLGSGMVHPRVIAACGLDPAEWQGFAFGCGIDRLAMLKYGMDDLRAFFDGDVRWLRHYGFPALDVPTLSGGYLVVKFTLSWLRDHLETEADAGAMADALTRIGLEVEGIHNPGASLAAFRIARVLTAAPHPQADKLQVLSVDVGDGPVQVVCGAPNARAGMVGVFGPPGAYVPGSAITLKVAAIRGVESNGMMCSTRELELGEEHDGIIELPADAPVGAAYPAWVGLDDPVFDVSVTPNRQDCMGVRGIARDLAAAGLGVLRPLEEMVALHIPVRAEPVGAPAQSLSPDTGPSTISGRTAERSGPNVRTDDIEGCPAFFAQAVAGVTNGPSPEWMRRRLAAIGQKPISALVDITNYLMFDLGRPLHVYDRATLIGPLVARRARAGESVVALNGRTYALGPGMTVIADDAQVHDIGGIMGGEHSGVSAATTDVLIECAFFDPDSIARTGQALALTSDARSRFERGVDPAFLDDGLAIATAYVVALCGGTASAVTRSGEAPLGTCSYAYDPTLAETLGGLVVAPERQRAILESLGFVVSHAWQVTPPTWRRDVDGAADLVEEVIRIEGLDKVASVALPRPDGVARPTATPAQKQERRTRRAAAARGLDEAVTWSFLSVREADAFGGAAWVLANPISEELRAMRPSLLPGLLAAAARNQKRGAGGVRLFEIGPRYFADKDGLSDERVTLGIVLAGDRRARGWREGKAAGFDGFDAKAEALALLAAAGAPVDNLQVMREAGPAWHPGQSGTLRLGPKTILAAFGMLHPATLKTFDLDGPVAAAELYLDAIPVPKGRGAGSMRAPFTPPALQPVRRDFAFTVPTGLAADTLLRAVRGADKASITAARLFDLFERDGIRSMAVEVTLQPGERSFTDAELKAIADKVVAAAAKQGAVLRG